MQGPTTALPQDSNPRSPTEAGTSVFYEPEPRHQQRVPGELFSGYFEESARYRTIRPKGSGDWLLFFTLSGQGRFQSPHKRWATADAGQLHLYDLGAAQDYGTQLKIGRWVFVFAHFTPLAEWASLLDWPEHWPGLRTLTLPEGPLGEAVRAAFFEMNRVRQGTHPRGPWLARNALERVLLLCDAVNPRRAHGRLDERVVQAMTLMGDNFSQALSVQVIASAVGLSESRLAHLFRAQTGQTLLAYLESIRLRHAQELLEWTVRPVATIAEACGFTNAFYFSSRFRKATGVSPTAYRKQRQKSATNPPPG
ncbi:MAG: helix-turn-helix domain-containing protein [Opitutales bacterium]